MAPHHYELCRHDALENIQQAAQTVVPEQSKRKNGRKSKMEPRCCAGPLFGRCAEAIGYAESSPIGDRWERWQQTGSMKRVSFSAPTPSLEQRSSFIRHCCSGSNVVPQRSMARVGVQYETHPLPPLQFEWALSHCEAFQFVQDNAPPPSLWCNIFTFPIRLD